MAVRLTTPYLRVFRGVTLEDPLTAGPSDLFQVGD